MPGISDNSVDYQCDRREKGSGVEVTNERTGSKEPLQQIPLHPWDGRGHIHLDLSRRGPLL